MPVQSADSTDSIDEKLYRVNPVSGNSLGLSIITLRENMKLGLRKLTPREHIGAACVLLFFLTLISADFALPEASRLRDASRPAAASILSWLPVFVFIAGLTVLLPLGGNNSRLEFFRQMGKIPLLVRFQLLVFLAVGIYISIKLFIS